MRPLSIALAAIGALCACTVYTQTPVEQSSVTQAEAGMIRGVVRNEDGWELSEIAVLATSEEGASRAGYSDRHGIYRIENLAPGQYTLRVRRGNALVLEQRVRVWGGVSRDVHLRVPTMYGDRPEQRQKPIVDRSLIHSSASRAW